MEEFDKARIILTHAIEVNPGKNYQKYMELAELNNGESSLKLY